MIYVIGTCHKTQLWTDLVTKRALGAAPLSKVAAFQKFVRDAAVTLQATIIAEELSEDTVLDYGYHAESVAAVIARDLDLRHILCEPSPRDGHLFADPTPAVAESPPGTVSERFAMRENWWARRLAPFSPNTTIVVFICGVAHCETFPETAEAERPRSSGLLPGRTPRRHCYQGVWLTEPSTRMQVPVALVVGIYFFVGLAGAAFMVLLIKWFWYFLLSRLRELSQAIQGR